MNDRKPALNFMFDMGAKPARQNQILAEIKARPDVEKAGRLVPDAKETSITFTMCYVVGKNGASANLILEALRAYSEVEEADVSAERSFVPPKPHAHHHHDHSHCDGKCDHKH